MFSFCPNCGESPGQDQSPGKLVVCQHCGHQIGVVPTATKAATVDPAIELIASGKAARCPLCKQLVELKPSGDTRSFVPHFAAGERKMCPGSGKPVTPASTPAPAAQPAIGGPALLSRTTSTGRDLSKHIQREVIRVVVGRKDGEEIQELTLEYLDKADRVRLQIEALREILGKDFRMKAYPAALKKPHLGLWGHADVCVIAKKHDQGGCQPMSAAEVMQAIADLRQHRALFFP